jgi:asparagine synthetase B (glutamine-hydrolysing)
LKETFDLPLLKAWLTIRYNPSQRCFVGGTEKNNKSRKLSVEDFKTEKFKAPTEKLADRLREESIDLVRNIASNIPAKSRIGVLLSGGMDSSTVLAVLVKLGYEPEAFTVGFGTEDDEIESASIVAKHLGVKHHIKTLDSILGSTAASNSVLEEPYRAACFYYDALKFAKDSGTTHVFDGLGVDEFYGGYSFRYEKVTQFIKNGHSKTEAYLRGSHPNDYTDNNEMFGPKLKGTKVDWKELFPYFDNNLSLTDQFLLADYNAKCRQNFIPLADFDKSLGIHIYYPWLADAFIDFSLRIPHELKYNSSTGETKILFRKAFGTMLPVQTLRKPKQGFGPSLNKVYQELRPLAEDTIRAGAMISEGYLNKSFYEKVLDKDSPTTVEINKLWDAYTLEIFLSQKK